MAMTFAEWLQAKRGRRGDPGFVSQGELARRMGVTRPYIVQLEDASRPLPTYPTRQKVHEALGTSEDELRELGIIPGPLAETSVIKINIDTGLVQEIDKTTGWVIKENRPTFDEAFIKDKLKALVQSVKWNPERTETVEWILRNYLAFDERELQK